ncbi:hypothetical protein C4569_00345 [Candidatus Parcubacteria bacterium]|nr:MAG: hypothetical protein C4569_00345 [Candidatus Parcubacteria bacterium]
MKNQENSQKQYEMPPLEKARNEFFHHLSESLVAMSRLQGIWSEAGLKSAGQALDNFLALVKDKQIKNWLNELKGIFLKIKPGAAVAEDDPIFDEISDKMNLIAKEFDI